MVKWGAYLLAVGAVALFLDDKALYVLVYSLAGVVFITEYLLRDVAGRLVVRVSLDASRVNSGEEANLTVDVWNPTGIPIPWVAITSGLPDAMLMAPRTHFASLAPHGRTSVSYPLVGARRGVYDVSHLDIRIGEGLRDGALPAAGAPIVPIELTVYPRVWPISPLRLPSRNPYGQTRSRVPYFEDISRVIGLRDYAPGDNLRRINWRATARVGQLQVKEFQPTISLDTTILLDLDPRDYPESAPDDFSELAIQVAASLTRLLIAESESVGFITNVGVDGAGPAEVLVRPANGLAQLTKVMDLLARIEAREGVDFKNTVHAGRLGAQPGSTVVVVVPGARGDLFDSCLLLQKAGYKVLLVVVGGTESDEALGAIMLHGVTVWQVFSTLDLERMAS